MFALGPYPWASQFKDHRDKFSVWRPCTYSQVVRSDCEHDRTTRSRVDRRDTLAARPRYCTDYRRALCTSANSQRTCELPSMFAPLILRSSFVTLCMHLRPDFARNGEYASSPRDGSTRALRKPDIVSSEEHAAKNTTTDSKFGRLVCACCDRPSFRCPHFRYIMLWNWNVTTENQQTAQ